MRPLRLLRPLVPAYAAALSAKNMAYARGWLPTHALRAPVISVGNLSLGGSGKTPLVIRLAELLTARGYAVDVLSRGYGRSGRGAERVEPEAEPEAEPGHEPETEPGHKPETESGTVPEAVPRNERAAARFGDEPVLIARAARVPVFVAGDRHAAGLLAERTPAAVGRPRVHLLDDGFQHRRLHRTVDIVVLHPGDLGEALLPAGRLREPWHALRRASILVLREEDAASASELRALGLCQPVWRMRRETAVPPAARTGPAVAFSGIAYPQAFFAALRQAGVTLAAVRPFPDHYAWSANELAGLRELATLHGAHTLLTTEKDLVRLSPAQRRLLTQACPLFAIPLKARLVDEETCVMQLLQRLRDAAPL